MSSTFPVYSFLFRIKKAISPLCPFCTQGVPETLTHFLKVCPKFHHARSAAHNQVREVLFRALKTHAATHWRILQETPLHRTGLDLHKVPTAMAQLAGRIVSDHEIALGHVSVARWQPDLICFSSAQKKIVIGPEVSLPSDSLPGAIQEAHDRKLKSYGPLIVALQDYTAAGWTVKILPWIVGARGMINRASLTAALQFLEIPESHHSGIINCTIRASIEALAVMYRLRFTGGNSSSLSSATTPITASNPQDAQLSVGRKRKSPKTDHDLHAVQCRWKRIATSMRR